MATIDFGSFSEDGAKLFVLSIKILQFRVRPISDAWIGVTEGYLKFVQRVKISGGTTGGKGENAPLWFSEKVKLEDFGSCVGVIKVAFLIS